MNLMSGCSLVLVPSVISLMKKHVLIKELFRAQCQQQWAGLWFQRLGRKSRDWLDVMDCSIKTVFVLGHASLQRGVSFITANQEEANYGGASVAC